MCVVPTDFRIYNARRHNREAALAYVRKKKARGKTVYQLVEGRREGGKVRQKVLVHLGEHPTVERALERWPARIVKLRLAARELREKVAFVQEALRSDGIYGAGFVDEAGEMIRRKTTPHTYSEWPKIFNAYAGAPHGTVESHLYRCYFGWHLHRHYWDHVDRAEKLEREADSLEERFLKLCVVCGGAPAEAKRELADRLRRIMDAKRRREERREAARLRAWGFVP